MIWRVIYHPQVRKDLKALGHVQADRALTAITDRLQNGEPHKSGKPLSGELAGYRRLRVGNLRIVYWAKVEVIEVFVLAVGRRRDDKVYATTKSRR